MSAPTLAELRADLAAACDNLRARIAAVRHHEAEANPGNHDDRDELAAAERDLQAARDEAVMASHEQVLALASYLLTVRWAPAELTPAAPPEPEVPERAEVSRG